MAPSLGFEELRPGGLLAEGGEGRVYELPTRPHLVYKAYRNPPPRGFLDDLVAWPGDRADQWAAALVDAATAWPAAVVGGGDAPPGRAAGVLMPRAPRRFSVRHRDGTTRLATLSYLTADPAYRAVAYGLSLPPALSAERIGLVYALARLIAAFESSRPRVGHGDLSTKNVLWSLQRGPEVFVLDCDNCERYDRDGRPLAHAGRRRAATPNWEDPAVSSGSNPTLESDRYSLALIFLRVAGAANFPIQARQRQGGPIAVDFAVPARYRGDPLLAPGAPVWALAEAGLCLSAVGSRPPATAWVAALEALLDGLGAADVMRAVWDAQGGGSPSPHPVLSTTDPVLGANAADVRIRPVAASHRPTPQWTMVAPPAAVAWRAPTAGYTASPAGIPHAGGALPVGSPQVAPAVAPPAPPPIRAQVAGGVAWWLEQHRKVASEWKRRTGARDTLRALALCAAVDAAIGLVALFIAAMAVAPVLGI